MNTVKLYLQNEGTNRKESVASLSPKTWYRLKIEFSRSSVEEENLVRVYVGEAGGECALVFEDNVYNKITSYDFDKVIFGHYTLRAGCLYLDNMSVSLSSKGSDASSEE